MNESEDTLEAEEDLALAFETRFGLALFGFEVEEGLAVAPRSKDDVGAAV